MTQHLAQHRVLVTGGGGYLGRQLVAALAALPTERRPAAMVSHDIREPAERLPGVDYAVADIRSPEIADIIARHGVDTVVHLASIVTPDRRSKREFEYDVDVNGTKNLLEACVRHHVKRIIVSSSGAAYGYHADNPDWLTEDMPLRGNEGFAYSHHKRLVEEMLAEYRRTQPQLEQTIFRIGTILGPTVKNQITDLFEKPHLIAIIGSDSPFVFIHDQDVVGAMLHGIDTSVTGIFNLAGDGKLSIHEIARRLGKHCVALPAGLLWVALWQLKMFGLTQYGPEQLDFLRYRPVLQNTRLKQEFGYVPKLTSTEVFELYRSSRQGKTPTAPRSGETSSPPAVGRGPGIG